MQKRLLVTEGMSLYCRVVPFPPEFRRGSCKVGANSCHFVHYFNHIFTFFEQQVELLVLKWSQLHFNECFKGRCPVAQFTA